MMTDPADWPGKRPDGSFHPVYLAQVKAEWLAARAHLVRAAAAGRAARKAWDDAVNAELVAHRRMWELFEAAGEPLPKSPE